VTSPADPETTLDEELLAKAKTIRQRPSETIVPAVHGPSTGGRLAIAVLSSLAAEPGAGAGAAIELGETLGEGGMGVVRLATQVALGRKVAVKTLRDETQGDAAILKLLREAWITGSLEHPNVVPVYDVGLDSGSRPLIVLKRIEGTEWSALMGDAESVEKRFGARDLLEWNLGILMQVCNAVRFAHSRGILHRDLKPDNVMIGEFGEVYVLDWGIAVSLRDDGSGRLPLARDATEMAGTPHYMAPEMLGGPGPLLSERTDVYLLGSILHEVVSGQPPHEGQALMAVIASVVASTPRLPEDAPEELRRIIERAMDRDPEARFENAEQVRLAIAAFLQHRGSLALAQKALSRLTALLSLIDGATPGDEDARMRLYNVFGECRFGFLSALDSWRDNTEARDGLRRATEAMVELELSHGDPRAAAALAAQIDSPSEELTRRIEAAVRERDAAQKEMAALAERGRQEDPAVGRRTRSFLAMTMGVIWTLTPLAGGFLTREEEMSWALTLTWPTVIFLLCVGAGVWARESMSKTAFNRRVGGAVLIAVGAIIPLHLANLLMGLTPTTSQVQMLLLFAVVAAYTVVAVDRRLLPVPVAYLIGYLVAARWPALRFYVLSASAFVLLVNATWLWRLKREDVELAGERAKAHWEAHRAALRRGASDEESVDES